MNADGGEILGGGANMVFYHVGYGMIDYHSFQARAGEQIRMICHYRGYKADFENKDIYLKHGTTTTLLITWDELPSNEDYEAGVPALDRTFTLT